MIKRLFILLAAGITITSCGTQESTQSADTVADAKPVMTEGHKLFINNCVQCHNIKTDKIGPKLEGVLTRWNNDTTRLRAFIHNSSKLIEAGDPRAVEVYNQYNKTVMTPMTHLSDGEIDDILEYIYTGTD
jgi:cytochrome c2